MFFIFGIGNRKSERIGPISERTCPNCNNRRYWDLVRVSSWFSLFFIPIFPYKNEYLLMCPVCRLSEKVNFDRFSELQPLAQLNLALADGRISQDEYNRRIKRLPG